MFLIFIWLYFVLLSALLSFLSEITSQNAQKHLRKSILAVSNCIINIIGNFCGIFIYGFVKGKIGHHSSLLPTHFLINIYWIGLGFIIKCEFSKWYQSELKENDNNVWELHENNQLRLTTTSDY